MELYGIPIDYWRGFVSALALVAMVYVWRMDVSDPDEPAFRDVERKREDEIANFGPPYMSDAWLDDLTEKVGGDQGLGDPSDWAIPFGGQVGLEQDGSDE